MRKLVVLLALAASGLFLINATPASAANCTPSSGNVSNVAGSIRNVAQISGCTGVTAVRFIWQPVPAYTTSGWWDATWNGYTWGYLNAQTNDVTITSTLGGWVYQAQLCYWSGGVTHTVAPHFLWQIKNAASPYNWGPIHDFLAVVPSYPVC